MPKSLLKLPLFVGLLVFCSTDNQNTFCCSQNPSNDTDDLNEEGFNEFEHQQRSDDDHTGQVFQTSSGFFNYQSFMKKESRVKWSKQETELFYEVYFTENLHARLVSRTINTQ